MSTYRCSVDGDSLEIEADSSREAAQEYVDGADWGPIESTTWINVYVYEQDESGEEDGPQRIKIAIQPDEPKCSEPQHDWQSSYEILGGLKENPGVWGHGGGVIIKEVCMHCGCLRVTDTWAQDRETGEQGLTSIRYEPGEFADDVERLALERADYDV